MHAPARATAAERTAPAELPPAVVLNMQETGLAIARSLGRRGVQVVGLGADARAPGNASRYVAYRRAPDSLADPDGLAAFLTEFGAACPRRPVLFPTNDADLACLDRHRERLAPWFTLALPESGLLHALSDKARLADLARAHGVAIPVTRRVDTRADLDALAADLVYPAVIKPVVTTAWRTAAFRARVGARKGWRVANHRECRAAYETIADVAPAAVIQEWIDGPADDCPVVGAALGVGGVALGAFTARKRVQYPPGVGLGCLVETTSDDDLCQRTLAFLRAIGFTGVCEVEYKLDRRTGAPRLIEINPRHWDQHGLGARVGVDLPWLFYRDLIGQPPGAFARGAGRAVWLRGSGLTGAAKHAVKTGDPGMLGALWRCLGRRRCYAFWASDDRRPVVQALRNRWFRSAHRERSRRGR